MSLNGLDDPKVQEAYVAASAEPGGWFLLKYASRDEVELLGRGTGGVVEARNAIAGYEDTSPLYGLLRYRRRNVILKYMPENCSRLVQARAAVHFNAVCERFTPYSTIFEIAGAKDLKDSKLSAACSLHAASGSSSSSTSSLRRRRLNEIVEEEEEEERERKRQSIVKEEDRPASSIYSDPPLSPIQPLKLPPKQSQQLEQSQAVLDSAHINAAPQEPNFAATSSVPEFTGVDRPTSPSKTEAAPRLSSQSARPELHSYATYTYGKPKVKLGPRPSLDANKRPSTAGNFRPIAALPAGFKLFSKTAKKDKKEDQAQSQQPGDDILTPSDNIPIASKAIPELSQDSSDIQLPPRPATSSGASVKSTAPSVAQSIKDKMTPEKARLMKAMKLREKKKNAMLSEQVQAQARNTHSPPIREEYEDLPAQTGQSQLTSPTNGDNPSRTIPHPESVVGNDLPTPNTINTDAPSEDTIPDSQPNSPTAATLSEVGESTKASSLSESTDETAQAPTKNSLEDQDEDGIEDGPEELSEIVEEAGLRMSAVRTPQEGASEPTVGSQDETADSNVSDDTDVMASQESPQIPQDSDTSLSTEIVRQIFAAATNQDLEQSNAGSGELSDEHTIEAEVKSSTSDAPEQKLGVPLSKFSSNEHKPASSSKSPLTPTLKSKFSIQDITTPEESIPELPAELSPPVIDPATEETLTAAEESANPKYPEIKLPSRSARRKAPVEPIRTDLDPKGTPGTELSDPLDDDDLMEELQSATVQEARHMIVSKSPITPVFPSHSPPKQARISRTVSSPMRGPLLVPGDVSQSSARSVSAGGAAYLHTVTRQNSSAGLQSKKGNLGSSISQRIKALEMLSGSTGGEEARPRTAAPSSTFFSVRRPTTRESSKSPSVADRANSLTRNSPTPDRSREGTPETMPSGGRDRSNSIASKLSMFEGQGTPRGRPESIQVTAKIVRDASHTFPRKPEIRQGHAEYSNVELKQSPLVVDLQTAEPAEPAKPPQTEAETPSKPKESIQDRRERKASEDGEEKKSRRSSLSIMREFIKDRKTSNKSSDNLAIMSPSTSSVKSPMRPPSSHQNSGGLVRRLSISSRRSLSRERDNNGSSTSLASPTVFSDSGSGDEDKTGSEKKSKKRTSRFMRRLSNSFGGGRKNLAANISPTVTEEDPEQLAALSMTESSYSSQPAIVSYIGDVNVQFPDNLLWKRRSMCLDAQGFLFLSAIQGTNGKEKTAGAGIKRYHLSDFRLPYIPDVEVQELPNSVVLDLVEGSCLQIACEDRAGQLNMLHVLQDAHQNHSSFGQ